VKRPACFSWLALSVMLMACFGCATTTPTVGGVTPVGTFESCTSDVLKGAEALVGQVATDLLTQNYESLILTLGGGVLTPELRCAVELAVADFSKKAELSSDVEMTIGATHGRMLLAAHP
jgi:hypothetical protein